MVASKVVASGGLLSSVAIKFTVMVEPTAASAGTSTLYDPPDTAWPLAVTETIVAPVPGCAETVKVTVSPGEAPVDPGVTVRVGGVGFTPGSSSSSLQETTVKITPAKSKKRYDNFFMVK
jgi:hypothetical protein